jgi:hypothetical protein
MKRGDSEVFETIDRVDQKSIDFAVAKGHTMLDIETDF